MATGRRGDTGRRRQWMFLAAASILACSAATAPAQAAAQSAAVNLDIPAQPLAQALMALSRQANVNVIAPSELTRGRQAPAVRGMLSVSEALARLLADSGLSHRANASGSIVISGSPLSGEAEAGGAAADDAGANAGATPEILVVGQRTLNADIRRTEEDAQPYVTFNRADLERSGARDLNEFLGQRLPSSNAFSSITGQSPGSEAVIGSQVALRGLPSNQTLILVDGRRLPDLAQNGFFRQGDISAIPIAAIERIEVLPATASGIYGGSAVGGVINIILRRNYTGLDLRLTYRNAADLEVGETRLDIAGGLTLEGGRTSVMFSALLSGGGELLAGERDFSARARALALANNPAGVVGQATPPLGATVNIRSTTGANLTLRPALGGASLGSPITSVPVGYGGVAGDNGAGLVAGAGSFNLDLANSAQPAGRLQNLVSVPSIVQGNLTVRREFATWLDAFVDVVGSRTETAQRRNDLTSSFTIAANAAGNPFQQQIRVTIPMVGADSRFKSTLESYRVAAGLIFDLPFDWRGEADYTWSFTSLSTFNAPTASAQLASDIASGALNIFQDPGGYAARLASYFNPRSESPDNDAAFHDAALRLSGPTGLSLPGGAVRASLLLERRSTRIGEWLRFTNGVPSSLIPSQRQRVTSGYGELLVPLVAPENGVPLINLLELQMAARWDRYVTVGSTSVSVDANGVPTAATQRRTNVTQSVDPTFGIRFKPIEDLAFRASYGTGFLPPSVNILVPAEGFLAAATANLLAVRDPLRGNEIIGGLNGVTTISGGRPDLGPERSTSYSAGVVVTPRFLPGFRATIDWVRISKRDAIVTLPFSQSTIDLLLAFAPERIVRDTSGNNGAFPIGRVTTVDITRANATSQRIEAYDFGLDYRLATTRLGTFTLTGNATYTPTYTFQLTPASPIEDRSGTAGATLKWRASAQLTWEMAGWTASWAVRYFGPYFVNTNRSVDLNLGSATIRSQTYHDLFVSYALPATAPSPLRGVELQFGVNNVFNVSPPLNPTGAALSLPISLLADARGASFYLGLRKTF